MLQRRNWSAVPAILTKCMKAVQTREDDNVALAVRKPSVDLQLKGNDALVIQKRSKNASKWIIRSVGLILVVLAGLSVFWYTRRPVQVALVQPTQSSITETITSSGRVGGVTETNAGSQTQGIVRSLYVDDGSIVVAGQQLALIKNDVAEAQITQARASVNTARTQLEQVSRGALASDIDAAMEQVRQTQAVGS